MNTLSLIEHPEAQSGPRHGGDYTRQNHSIIVNGFLAEQYTSGTEAAFKWSCGTAYKKDLNARVAWWEKLLKCKAVRGRTDQPLAAFCKGAG